MKMQVKYRNFAFDSLLLFSLKFVGIVFISSSYNSITSPQIIVKLSIILAKYFKFSQIHVAGFQV